MNNFVKHWITITCAPDSIRTIISNNKGYLDIVANEDKSKFMYVLHDNKVIISMGQNYDDIKIAKYISFSHASNEIANYFGILSIKL